MAHFYSRFSFISSYVIVERIMEYSWKCLTIAVYMFYIEYRDYWLVNRVPDQVDLNLLFTLYNYYKIQ